MKNLIYLFLACIALACTEQEKAIEITVTNSSSLARTQEIAEVSANIVNDVLDEDGQFIITDANGNQIPYQLTYDNKLIFPVTVAANGTVTYQLKPGTPEVFPVMATGKHYPERVDDIAWENDRIAFRTYGPALQATGERAFGYDIWVKRVPEMVVEDRYATELNPETTAKITELRKTDRQAAQELYNSVSYHIDHGNGLDYYSVGPTLGGGTSAIWYEDDIIYPYCYKTYEILDNGPLRFTVKLVYNPLTVGDNTEVTETRFISLDAGSQLNKFRISYDNLAGPQTVVTGIVMHESDEMEVDASAGYIAYAEETDPVNGQTYVGAVFPEPLEEARPVYFSDAEKKDRKAEGHVLAFSNYEPGATYTYYAGGGWSKWGFATPGDWYAYMQTFAQKVKEPLTITQPKK